MPSPKHPCKDCGKPCESKSLRCITCASLLRRTGGRWSRVIPHYCIDCGNPIAPGGTRCASCSAKLRWSTVGIPQRSGVNHPCWRGGRVKTVGGYINIYKPDHPRATSAHRKYVLEHILVWEEVNNKSLPQGWVIHHLNGIPSDNRIENLKALPKRKHSLVLAAKAKRIQELEALLNNQRQLI